MKDESIDQWIKDAVPIRAEETLEKGTPEDRLDARPELPMRDREESQDVDTPTIFGSNGIAVTCTYVNHPAWDEDKNICISLHFIMLKLGPTRVSSWAYALRLAITYFLDFMADHNHRHPIGLQIKHIRDLTPSVHRGFGLYLDKRGKARNNANLLKSAIKLATQETSAVPDLLLPSIKSASRSSTEPLGEEGVKNLTLVTRQIADAARQTIARRIVIDSLEPYTYDELEPHFNPRMSKNDILVWVKYQNQQGIRFTKDQALIRIQKCDHPDIVALREEPRLRMKLKQMAAVHANVQIPEGYDSHINRLNTWFTTTLDPHRIVKTLNAHGFPFQLTQACIRNKYITQKITSLEHCSDVIQLILHKLSQVRAKYNLANENCGLYMPSLDEHLALYYPTAADMAGIASLMMLQSGWNKETAMQVDKDNFEHPLTSTIEESIKIIYSEKIRGQGSSIPYTEPKQILAASDSDNPYSLYNLILLAKEFTAPLAPYINGLVDPLRNRQVNTLFAHVRPWNGWLQAKSSSAFALSTLDYTDHFQHAIADLLDRYEVTDNGKRLTSASEITRQLRVTWLFFNAQEISFAFLSQLLGHQSRDTTDESYDNSPQARAERHKRLRSALEHIVELLRARKFKGLLGKQARALANTKLSIFFLPHLERALWACRNRYKPDWPGAPKLPKGEKCDALDQCLFCSRVWILEDSLPYLIERLTHIDELLRDGSMAEFGSRLEAEQNEINAILDAWSDEEAIDEALQYRYLNSPLLPRNIRELRLIFKTGDLDE